MTIGDNYMVDFKLCLLECLPPSELLEFECIPSNKGLMELQALGRAHLEPNKEKVPLTDGSFNILLRPVRIILF